MVYLVGAGPGDPELLTVRAARLLGEADVVIYDRLIEEGVLDMIRPGAERIFVGKSSTFHSRPQEEINLTIKDKALEGGLVVRLKGGDPYIFGRGGEEAYFLMQEGIAFEVVPGVTAASGASARSHIPLTDRRVSSAVTFVAGHKMTGRGAADLQWDALAALNHTLVFYMALTNLGEITRNLIGSGMKDETPAALVKGATTAGELIVAGTLRTISGLAEEMALRPPVLLIVGDVIGLAPLYGTGAGSGGRTGL